MIELPIIVWSYLESKNINYATLELKIVVYRKLAKLAISENKIRSKPISFLGGNSPEHQPVLMIDLRL